MEAGFIFTILAFTKLISLMNFQDGYDVSASAQLFQKELELLFLILGLTTLILIFSAL